MSLNQNKKAKMMEFLIGFAILIVSFFIILGIWNIFFSKAEGATAEIMCRNFNAARTKTEINVAKGLISFNLVPRTCKTLHRDIPTTDYPNTVEGTMSEMSYLVARCWWQWLEGTQPNIFGDKWWWKKNKCFICYTFNIKKGIDPFQSITFQKFLDEHQYIVKDTSDICNFNGGGYCKLKEEGCSKDEEQIPSNRCPKEEVNGEIKERICCNKEIECENKGGICLNECGVDQKEYEGWSCKGSEGEKCCIKEENFLSYTRYVQEYMGEGSIIIDSIDKFLPLEETYAITFYSKTNNWLINWFGNKNVVDSIRISKLKDVETMCAVEADVSGT